MMNNAQEIHYSNNETTLENDLHASRYSDNTIRITMYDINT